jgi:signal transduction histidine kinase
MGPTMTRMFLAVDPLLAVAAVLINFIFVILVLVRTSRTNVYKIFFFICISVMYWNLSELMRYITGVRYWFYLSRVGSAFIPALMFHFIMTLVRPSQKNTRWTALAYFFSCLLALLSIVSVFSGGTRTLAEDRYWDASYFLSFGPFFLGGLYMLIHAIGATRSEDEKSRLRYILISDIIGLIAVTTDHAQTLKIPAPPLGHLGSVLYSSILAVAIFKHRAAYDIIAQIELRMKMLSETAAGIAHEIRNPLTSIKAAAELASDEIESGNVSKSREYMDIIAEETERLNGILTDFQYFTKPLTIDRKNPVSVNEVIQKTVTLSELGMARIHIRRTLAGDLPAVWADASLLKQVFLNLIKNAAEACGAGCEMVISTEYIPPYVRIDLCDNGPGMPPEILKRIFEPFFTTKASGTGMGLAICERIIQAHNGKIEAENILPNGMKFSVFLPVKE